MNYFLTKEQFRHALHRGLGRALLHLKHHPDFPYDDELLFACTHWTGYDAQVDGVPTAYLWTALRLGGGRDRLRDRIVAAFRAAPERELLRQLLALVDQYARNGDDGAGQAILRGMEDSNPDSLEDYPRTIINRFGEHGLVLVALEFGKRIASGTYKYDWIDISSVVPRWMDADRAMAVVRRLVDTGPGVDRLAIMMDDGAKTRTQGKADVKKPSISRAAILKLPFVEFREWVRSVFGGPPLFHSGKWGEKASVDELRAAAEQFLNADDEFDRKLGLLVFANTPFPLDPQPLIDLTTYENERTVFHALRAMRQTRHPKVRAFFEASLTTNSHLRELFGLLLANYVPGDEAMIVDWIERYQTRFPVEPTLDDICEQHGIQFDLLDVFDKYSDVDGAEVITWVYEQTRCKCCRGRALKYLIDRGKAGKEMLVECTFDQAEWIRSVARSKIRKIA